MNAVVDRRRVLLATAGASALAGCSSSRSEGSPSSETGDRPGETASAEIAGISAMLQYVRPRDGRRPEILATEDRQYVVVTFGAPTSDASDVALRLDGTEYASSFTATADGRLDVGFEVPLNVAAESATVLVGGESHPVYRDVLDRLSNPPRLTSVSFDADAEVRPGTIATVDVRVRNEGGPGPFKGVFEVPGAPPKVFSERIDGDTLAGYTTHATIGSDVESGDRTAVFDTGFQRQTTTVTIVERSA
ncbi:hypothetical protein [Halopiger djelfimassiliensis]|uniref:hypothetical protein n=1 Tax=Halopiger djelfimassiliensis TaxID=1293047 RepID=UPI000677F7A7|nr:hypothetical protein [Halopiger djelfimassiliensis]